ncbi:MAG: ATP F0F1 synthase subunit C [Anaerolineaceae bacterium]|jgi:F-type H+-transporting ATPase subunit c|nr:ATP F0F1 synthase subunit C [Anaerolineaceae bacterium]
MDWSTLPWDKVFVIVTVLVSGLGIAFGIIVPAIGQAIVASSGLKAIGRQPEAGDRINSIVLLSLAMLESLAIYVLAVILILVFANPMRAYMLGS